jgi:imidazole glycerol phosphate synthase glutamine amidotransferase subunit
MIALIDYGVGNLQSVEKGLVAAGARVCRVTQPSEIDRAAAVVVPGVGHFGATATLGADWRTRLRAFAADGRPLLGICLGMQGFFEGSDEAPGLEGLGLFPGRCTRLAAPRVPHVGWNSLDPCRESTLLDGIPPGAQVYFTHSFAAPVTDTCIASTDYGAPFASLAARGHVAGAQFHPEKSGAVGLRFLRNFLAMISRGPDGGATLKGRATS